MNSYVDSLADPVMKLRYGCSGHLGVVPRHRGETGDAEPTLIGVVEAPTATSSGTDKPACQWNQGHMFSPLLLNGALPEGSRLAVSQLDWPGFDADLNPQCRLTRPLPR